MITKDEKARKHELDDLYFKIKNLDFDDPEFHNLIIGEIRRIKVELEKLKVPPNDDLIQEIYQNNGEILYLGLLIVELSEKLIKQNASKI